MYQGSQNLVAVMEAHLIFYIAGLKKIKMSEFLLNTLCNLGSK